MLYTYALVKQKDKRIAALEAALALAIIYIKGYYDSEDGDEGRPIPNSAMRVMQEIEEILG